MSNATAPPPSLTCPAWCTQHQGGGHPDDELHWSEVDLEAFTGLGLEPRLTLCQHLSDAEPVFMFELLVSKDDELNGPKAAAAYFRTLGEAFLTLAASTGRLVTDGDH